MQDKEFMEQSAEEMTVWELITAVKIKLQRQTLEAPQKKTLSDEIIESDNIEFMEIKINEGYLKVESVKKANKEFIDYVKSTVLKDLMNNPDGTKISYGFNEKAKEIYGEDLI